MFVESRFGRVELGSINNVAYRMHFEAPEAFSRGWLTDDGNLTNLVANPTGSPSLDSTLIGTQNRFFDNDSEKINYYTPRFSGFQVGVSYIPNSSQDRNGAPEPVSTAYSRGLAAGANFVRTFGSFDVAASVGYLQWKGPQTIRDRLGARPGRLADGPASRLRRAQGRRVLCGDPRRALGIVRHQCRGFDGRNRRKSRRRPRVEPRCDVHARPGRLQPDLRGRPQ